MPVSGAERVRQCRERKAQQQREEDKKTAAAERTRECRERKKQKQREEDEKKAAAERTRECRERNKQKQREEDRKKAAAERVRLCRERKKRNEQEQQQQQQRTMSSDDEGPPPPVETPSRARLPPIAELTPLQLQAIERSRVRQNGVAQTSISKIAQIYANENAAEDQFQQAVLGIGGAEDLLLAADPNAALALSSPHQASASAATRASARTPHSNKKSGTMPRSNKKSGTGVAAMPRSNKKSRAATTPRANKSSSSTPRSASTAGTTTPGASQPSAARKPASKRSKHSIPQIDPSFAMIKLDLFTGQDHVLSIATGAGAWNFNLSKHLATIQESYQKHDIYLVGYRNEERPVIASIHQSDRVYIPYFAVHVLPKGARPPNWVVDSDLEAKTEKFYALSQLPLKWVKVYVLPTGQTVMMLQNSTRKTARALAAQECPGGQFWFALPVDYKKNPGERFQFSYNNDTFYFSEESWDLTRQEIKRILKEEESNWSDFCRSDADHWLGLIVGVAVDKFFEYEEDLPRDVCEAQVKELLFQAFQAYKADRQSEEEIYDQHKFVTANSGHFKIYPENQCLVPYLQGDCSTISKWSGKAEAVYPIVPPPPPKTGPDLDLWGNPKSET